MARTDRIIKLLDKTAGENTDLSGQTLIDALGDAIRNDCKHEFEVEDQVFGFLKSRDYLMDSNMLNGLYKQTYAHRVSPFEEASNRAKARAKEVLK